MAKTKALISFAVTEKLICVFVFAYAKNPFSHDEAQLSFFLVVSSQQMVLMQWKTVPGQFVCASCMLEQLDPSVWKHNVHSF